MSKPLVYVPGADPYFVDSDCVCGVVGDGSAAHPYLITYCARHEERPAPPTAPTPMGPHLNGAVLISSYVFLMAILVSLASFVLGGAR